MSQEESKIVSSRTKRLSIVGLGYVGLTTAVGFELKGHKVIGIDINDSRIDKVNSRPQFIYEEGLSKTLRKVGMTATSNFRQILASDITFFCVGTPSKADGTANLDQLKKSVEQVTEVLKEKKDYHLIVVRSTALPGTTEEVIIPIVIDGGNCGVCVNPEFLSEGTAMYDFMNPSRIIIGEYDKKSGDMLCDLYSSFSCPIFRTNLRTAEMIKYASNTFLATKISFINEIGNICKKLDIDVYEVAKGMGYDERIGNQFLNAGIGFGGSCLPKDIEALVAKSKEIGYEPKILEQVLQLNNRQCLKMVELLKKHISLRGRTIGILGLAFKPGTDDIRESRAITIVETLLKEGSQVKAYDPKAMPNFKQLFPQIEYVEAEQVLNSDAILILTEWSQFDHLDYTGKIVIDGRRVLGAKKAKVYEGVCW